MKRARTPARRVVTVSSARPVGTFPSRKAGGLVEFESLLELDAMVVLEADRHVASFHAQPITFRWRDADGRPRRYTPDLLVEMAGGPIFREVKPERRLLRNPTLDGRLAEIVARCGALGAGFEPWSSVSIRREPRLSNSRAVVAAGRWRAPDRDAEDVVLRAAMAAGVPLRVVEDVSGLDGRRVMRAALRLAVRGRVGLDLDRPLGGDTRMFRGAAR